MPLSLSQDQIDLYNRDGYLFPIRAVSPEKASETRKRLERIEAEMGGRFTGIYRSKFYLRYQLDCWRFYRFICVSF